MVKLPVISSLKKTESLLISNSARTHQLWRGTLQQPCHHFKEFCSMASFLGCPSPSHPQGQGWSQKLSMSLILYYKSAVSSTTAKEAYLYSQQSRSLISTLFLVTAKIMVSGGGIKKASGPCLSKDQTPGFMWEHR